MATLQILNSNSPLPDHLQRIYDKLIEIDPNIILDLNQFEINPTAYLVDQKYCRFQCQEKETSQKYALKILRQEYLDNPIASDNLIAEITILAKYKNPMIIGFKGFVFAETVISEARGYRPILILEFTPHPSLRSIIHQNAKLLTGDPVLNSTKKMISMIGIAACLAYLHKNRIIHRNFSPYQVYFDDHFYPKVAGFEQSIIVDANQEFDKLFLKLNEEIGTSMYMPPEIIENDDEHYSSAIDMFSFALSVYELFSLKFPFNFKNPIRIISAIVVNERPNAQEIPNKELASLIQLCWDATPSKRPTFQAFLESVVPNKEFWPDDVDENEFYQYLHYIGLDPSTGKFVSS